MQTVYFRINLTILLLFFLQLLQINSAIVANINLPEMKTPVILVHGINDNAQKMECMAKYLRNQGWEVYTISLNPSSGKVGIDVLAEQLKKHLLTIKPKAIKI